MNLETFENKVTRIYEALPSNIQSKFQIVIEEEQPEGQKEILFGKYWGAVPNSITLCYWGFKMANDFRLDHIERVIKHEFEHLLLGNCGGKHSEH